MRVASDSAYELINDIAAAWERRKRPAFTLPYNRFAWQKSQHWWVVPSSEKVAFRYSKISVASVEFLTAGTDVFVGLYVEKGVGRVMTAAGASDDWIMSGDWRWHGMIRDSHSVTPPNEALQSPVRRSQPPPTCSRPSSLRSALSAGVCS